MSDDQVLATFYGDDEFPVQWEEGQRELFWVHDDLHIPNPISPMYADIGGWWLKCDYMFRRFGTPFAADWIAKVVNGYVYTAAIPATPGLSAEASEYGARYTPRVPLDAEDPAELGAYMGWTLPYYADHFLVWWRDRLLVMVHGEVALETTSAALLADEDAQRRYLGVEPTAA